MSVLLSPRVTGQSTSGSDTRGTFLGECFRKPARPRVTDRYLGKVLPAKQEADKLAAT